MSLILPPRIQSCLSNWMLRLLGAKPVSLASLFFLFKNFLIQLSCFFEHLTKTHGETAPHHPPHLRIWPSLQPSQISPCLSHLPTFTLLDWLFYSRTVFPSRKCVSKSYLILQSLVWYSRNGMCLQLRNT